MCVRFCSRKRKQSRQPAPFHIQLGTSGSLDPRSVHLVHMGGLHPAKHSVNSLSHSHNIFITQSTHHKEARDTVSSRPTIPGQVPLANAVPLAPAQCALTLLPFKRFPIHPPSRPPQKSQHHRENPSKFLQIAISFIHTLHGAFSVHYAHAQAVFREKKVAQLTPVTLTKSSRTCQLSLPRTRSGPAPSSTASKFSSRSAKSASDTSTNEFDILVFNCDNLVRTVL